MKRKRIAQFHIHTVISTLPPIGRSISLKGSETVRVPSVSPRQSNTLQVSIAHFGFLMITYSLSVRLIT